MDVENKNRETINARELNLKALREKRLEISNKKSE